MFCLAAVVCLVGLATANPVVVRTEEEVQQLRTYLESTKTSDEAQFLARLKANPKANPEENSGRFDGDILLDDFMIEEILKAYALGRNAVLLPNTKWPGNTVVWEFAEGAFNPQQQTAIENGIKEIETHTCIKFRHREPQDKVYVKVTGNADGCYSSIGYRTAWEPSEVRTLNLAPNGCLSHGTIVHEWMHVLGFVHMQSTHNRDEYVRIVRENIMNGTEGNFVKFTDNVVDNLGVEYDYVSCLHYGPYAFTNNGQPTIIALKEHEGQMGQREYITEKDWLRIKRHYNCAGAWPKTEDQPMSKTDAD